MKRSFVFLLLLLAMRITLCMAQVAPAEGSKLNYRLIGFSFPDSDGQTSCQLAIATGNIEREDSFRKSIIRTIDCSRNRVITEVPGFGTQYTWSVITGGHCGALHHFSTGSPYVDSGKTRLGILLDAVKYRDALVLADGNRAMYDMKGNMVWYLPEINGKQDEVRDLKLSPFGTITFLLGQSAYEVDYNGNVLWKGPEKGTVSGDTSEHFHHELTRLANGHYMVLGEETVTLNVKDTAGMRYEADAAAAVPAQLRSSVRLTMGTVIEYDKNGYVVWYWKSSKYFDTSDFRNYTDAFGQATRDVHENAFYFDEREQVVYLSFKGISRILKIAYPGGNVRSVYGERFVKGQREKGNGLFCAQHNCRVAQNGSLYLFNNNEHNWPEPASVVAMKQSKTGKQLIKEWEYKCVSADSSRDAARNRNDKRGHRTSGGSVFELPGREIFVSVNAPQSHLFIVNARKEILWSAVPEKWNMAGKKWTAIPQYRASIITDHQDFEKLVWSSYIK